MTVSLFVEQKIRQTRQKESESPAGVFSSGRDADGDPFIWIRGPGKKLELSGVCEHNAKEGKLQQWSGKQLLLPISLGKVIKSFYFKTIWNRSTVIKTIHQWMTFRSILSPSKHSWGQWCSEDPDVIFCSAPQMHIESFLTFRRGWGAFFFFF